jgi:ABC-type transport system substrate-binding protein
MPRLMIFTRVTLVAVASLLAIACGGCASKQAAPCDATQSRTLRIAMVDERAQAFRKFTGVPIVYWTSPSLVWVNQHGAPIGGLARSWQRTDPRTWTFTLRPDLRTHDGQAFPAARVRTALLARIPDSPNFVFRDLDTLDAPAPDTLVFRFKRPVNLLPEAIANIGLGQGIEAPALSAGPWRITKETTDQLELAAFPSLDSPDHEPGTPTALRVTRYPNMRAAWAAFLRNDVDFVHQIPRAAVPSLSQNPDIRLYMSAPAQLYAFGFQRKAPAVRDVRIRQAINLAIDREDIVRRLFGGYPPFLRYAKPIEGPFSLEYWAMQGQARLWPYDPAKARALLAEARGGRTDPLEITCITSNEFTEDAELAAIVEAQLQRINIHVRLEALPYRPLIARLEQGDFDSYIMPMNTGFTGMWAYTFWHSDVDTAYRVGRMGYNGADEALERLYAAAAPDAERSAVRDVMEAMRRDPPAAFLVANPIVRGVRNTWRVPDDDSDIRLSVHRWKLDRPCGTS